MIYKLLFYIVLALLFLIVIIINNRPIEFNLVFYKIKDIPLIVLIAISFLLGFLFSSFIFLKMAIKKHKKTSN